ncbi:hypothetical protein [Natrinema ejinorense]|uniref:DUF5658 domain-containing protein n=1 Tax=Natrinema ejinorense TaxID=373386 RepID=A0A2A5QP32_9EURY|nr:hypothetical protein [Natrinema ejinorense]PCR88611.1 hypothetical protein CP557_21490 [Natrinema ejinorense]
MTNTDTADSSDDLPMPVAFPSISRNPRRAIPIIVALHGPLDLITAYWMMSVRGPGVEWNAIASTAFEAGPLAYAAFGVSGTVLLAAALWYGRGLWEERWMPPIAEILILIGLFGLVGGNTLAALGVAF